MGSHLETPFRTPYDTIWPVGPGPNRDPSRPLVALWEVPIWTPSDPMEVLFGPPQVWGPHMTPYGHGVASHLETPFRTLFDTIWPVGPGPNRDPSRPLVAIGTPRGLDPQMTPLNVTI